MLVGGVDFNHFISLLVVLPLPCLRSQVLQKAKSAGFILLHAHFSTDQDEIWCGDKAIQVEHPFSLFIEIYGIKGNKCCFTDLLPTHPPKKPFSVCMHSDIY